MRPGNITRVSPPRTRKFVEPNARMNLRTDTVRDFSGGWDSVTNELIMPRRFARKLQNMHLDDSGSISVRYGTKLFVDLATAGMSTIVGMEYFSTYICAVDDRGRVALIQGDGTIYVVWDESIADSYSVRPWSATTYVSFAQMRNQLVICNGVDKPLAVQTNRACNYLVDLGTLLNTRVPIGKYIFAHQRYLIIAGDPLAPSTIYIGSRDTVGTFFGDPPPNDAVNIDLASYISGDPTIIGINAFREFLVVAFPNASLVAQLGVYSGSQHVPRFDDPLQEIGVVAHKTMAFLGDDLFSLDIAGVQSLNRVFVTNKLEPTSMSDRIQPDVVSAVNRTNIFTANATSPFAIYHHNQSTYFLFVPNDDTLAAVTETRCFALLYQPEIKQQAWADFRGWNWRSVCKSLLHDLFLSRGTEIFIYGRNEAPVYGDYAGSEETWTDNTAFTDNHGWSPVADVNDPGIPIPFAWELPWNDMRSRMELKSLQFLQVDSKGTGQFSVQGFVDNLYLARDLGEEWQDGFMFTDDLGWERAEPLLQPHIELQLIGGDAAGYGLEGYGNGPFGGGRMTNDERLYAFPLTGKLFKLRISGETNQPLSFQSISYTYSRGAIGR